MPTIPHTMILGPSPFLSTESYRNFEKKCFYVLFVTEAFEIKNKPSDREKTTI